MEILQKIFSTIHFVNVWRKKSNILKNDIIDMQNDLKFIIQFSWVGKEYVRKPILLRKVCPQMYSYVCVCV